MKKLFSLAIAISMTACVAHGQATMGVDSTAVVYQDPPPPRVETFASRPGFVFVKGRWTWQQGQWTWTAGHWERERGGYAWNDGHWEHHGNRWDWIDGTWSAATSSSPIAQGGVTVGPTPTNTTTVTHGETSGGVTVTESSTYPNAAPPPVRVENQGPRAGFVWISGRWDWSHGQWAWVAGHWERQRANQVWIAGRWELQGNRWTWTEGRWDRGGPPPPVVRDHR
ncbi:MAG: YXWGXW repeat-containing protein [Kofleriaceae bacterium]